MSASELFEGDTWSTALEKYGAATGLTVTIYGIGGQIACGPVNSTPLFDLFGRHGYEPGILAECARRCLTQVGERPAVVVAPEYGLAVIGTSLLLEDEIVGAAIAGYALIDFCQASAIEQLAREAGVPLRELWDIARRHQPMPERRLVVQGELLQVLGDAILRENHRTRQLADESAAKDDFLAMLSHELRTPLTPIRAWARMLKLHPTDPAHSLRAAEVIERNAVLQTRLVDDLLELNRASRGTSALVLRVHDLAHVVRSATETVLPDALEKGITLDVEAPEPLLAEVDRDRVEQIFRNVLSNAVKFTPAGGRISVHVASDAQFATVTVSDTGEGIAAEFLPFAFERFRQQERGTRRKHSGLGVGLTLVKQLTELHAGEVTLASDGVGFGTVVTIRLPLASSAAAGVQPPLPADELPDLTGLRLLVVDDHPDTRVALQLLLEGAGADVRHASDGVEALALVQQGGFDVVLCDLRMPLMDGYEFMRALSQARGVAPPVIATSGFASGADHLRTEAAGFAGHVVKPFDLRRLAAALDTAIGPRNELAPRASRPT